MSEPEEHGTCADCIWWSREPELANALRRPEGSSPTLGVCQLKPPVLVGSAGFRISLFPEVRAHRFCGSWEGAGDGGDGDGGERAPNVVPLRGVA